MPTINLGLRRRLFATLLLVVADPPSFRLHLAYFSQIKAHSAGAKGVGFWAASVLFKGGTETADECVEATPSLAERTRTRGRWVGMAVKRAVCDVDFGFAKLVQVAEELEDVSAAAAGKGKRRSVIF